ncbi:MAG: hypothetical protein JWO52_2914 [Gammaproteobacteria bacterium]|nr:hypothetical protein [Gammaproteobacteria bacterium]
MVNHTLRREPLSAKCASIHWQIGCRISYRWGSVTAGGLVVSIGLLAFFAGIELAGPLGGPFQHLL